ncbi:MAG TPA: hypothetical protein VJM11_07035 [Nevskiaceae bacterium]|nr:hypothetical protein [Nevskiaceae bacterium]
MRKLLVGLAVILVAAVLVMAGLWAFARDATLTWLLNSPVAVMMTRSDQADPTKVWAALQTHRNPPDARDDFDGEALGPAWRFVNLNGRGIVTRPPEVHAADARIADGALALRVLHDPDFEQESDAWKPGQAAATRYNNAYTIGFQGYSPTPTHDVVIETRYAVSRGFHGSTGLWIEEQDTFEGDTGVMVKPFRAFGTSYLGPDSQTPLGGAQIEAVMGFVPVCARRMAPGVDVTKANVYRMVWSVVDEKRMRVALSVNGQPDQSCTFPSFHPGEIQLWADNYRVTGIQIGHLNVPEGVVDETRFDYVSVAVVPK